MAFDRARAELLKNNPEEDQAALDWMKAFAYSPEAEQWNNAKLNGQNPYLNLSLIHISEPTRPY